MTQHHARRRRVGAVPRRHLMRLAQRLLRCWRGKQIRGLRVVWGFLIFERSGRGAGYLASELDCVSVCAERIQRKVLAGLEAAHGRLLSAEDLSGPLSARRGCASSGVCAPLYYFDGLVLRAFGKQDLNKAGRVRFSIVLLHLSSVKEGLAFALLSE